MTISPPSISSPGWSARTKRTVVLICLLLIGIALWQVADILPLIVIAVVLSYLLNPIVTFIDERILNFGPFEKRSMRWLGILVSFIIVLAIFLFTLILVAPILIDQLQEFGRRVPALFETLQIELQRILSQPITIGNQVIVPLESIQGLMQTPEGEAPGLGQFDISGTLTGVARSFSGTAFGFLGSAFSALVNLVFLLTMMFYLMKDGAMFAQSIVDITPPAYKDDARRLLYELSKVWDAYLRGQLILSLSMGILVFLAALILGVPNAPILGLLSALLEFIPNIGPALALLPAALLALSSQSATLPFLEGGSFALVVIVVWTLLQNIEAVVLVPRVMGSSLNLHPFAVMVGVIAGASLAGALGIILAAPVLASLRVIGQYIYGKLADRNPFVEMQPIDRDAMRRRTLTYRAQQWARSRRAK